MVIRSLPMRVNLISLASLIAMSLILGISGASVVGANERRFSFSRAQLAASEIAEGMERFLAGGGAIEDFLGFDEAWSSARGQDGSLGGAALFDARGNMLFSDGRVDAAWVPEPAHLVPGSRERAGGSRAAHPVLSAEGGIVGYAVVAVDEGALRRIGGGIVSVMALMSLSLVAGTAVIQGLLFRRGIGIPLRRLVATADSLASGDIGKLPDLERYAGQSDVGRIYAAFARLVGRLLEAQADLVEQNKALDETVRKRTGMLEGAYAELAADLERRAALEGELVAAKEGAEAANKAKGAFLAAMSHEIRTPMNSILGYLEFLSRGKLGEEERDYITIVESNARHLLALIDDILDFSKIESGRLELADEVFDPAQVFARSARMLEPKAAEKGVALSISAESGFGCRGDGLRLGQVVVNLVGNAVKFTDEGGRVEAALGAAREPGGVRLSASVADTGIGIERDKIGRIFGAFSQADAMIAGRYGGTGLGLAISAWIVKAMGGKIEVESEPGEGSRFSFSVLLPEAELDAAAREARDGPAAAAPASACSGRSALVAEDTKDSRLLIVKMLELLGMKVDAASDGSEALALFERGRYDIVILDGQMPVMDGVEAARRMREVERERGAARTPIIALSARVLAEEREEFSRAGMDGFLGKPVSLDSLSEAVSRLVGCSLDEAAPKGGEGLVASVSSRFGVDESFAAEIIGEFSSSLPARLEEARAALRDRDADRLGGVGHALRGSALYLGSGDLAEAAAKAEGAAAAAAADDGAWPRAALAVEGLADAVRAFLDDLAGT